MNLKTYLLFLLPENFISQSILTPWILIFTGIMVPSSVLMDMIGLADRSLHGMILVSDFF